MEKLVIEEEINVGSLNEFIRKFVDEIIISKIDGDRYNIKLDIYLDCLDDNDQPQEWCEDWLDPNDLLEDKKVNESIYEKLINELKIRAHYSGVCNVEV